MQAGTDGSAHARTSGHGEIRMLGRAGGATLRGMDRDAPRRREGSSDRQFRERGGVESTHRRDGLRSCRGIGDLENPPWTTVLACLRFPLKSGAPEKVQRLSVTPQGILGDRTWAVLDADGMVVSAKHPSRGGRLLRVSATHDDASGEVTLRVPGRPDFGASDPEVVGAVSEWLGHPVTLTDLVPPGLRLHRLWPEEPGMLPEWAADARPGQAVVTEVAGARARRFVDFGAVHLVTTGALRALEGQRCRPVSPLRFRPNLILDLPEDPEPGRLLHIGDATLRVDLATPRCIVPSLSQPGGIDADPDLLRILARRHRQPVAQLGRAAVFGRYASVLAPGRIEVGGRVRLGRIDLR